MIDRLIAAALPIVPKGVVRRVAGRYIAGPALEDAIRRSAELAGRGFTTTIDHLGEDTLSFAQARAAAETYVRLIDAIAASGVERNVSIKLSQIGLRLDRERAFGELERVLEAASRRGAFVRIDMEDSSLTDATLELHERARRVWANVGTVLQARLRRTLADARELARTGASVRLCKGIYREAADVAFVRPDEIRAAYVDDLRALLAGGARVGIATHDLALIARAEAEIAAAGVPRSRYEFQALLGVPMRTELERLRDAGNTVRLYVPYGDDWYAYSLRRLKENPSMAGAIAKGLFRRDRLT